MENKIYLVPLFLRLTVEQEVQIRKWAMPYDQHCERGHRAEAARVQRKHCYLRLVGWR